MYSLHTFNIYQHMQAYEHIHTEMNIRYAYAYHTHNIHWIPLTYAKGTLLRRNTNAIHM